MQAIKQAGRQASGPPHRRGQSPTRAPALAMAHGPGRPLRLAAIWWALSQAGGAAAIDLEWTKYSDRADLPMSRQWREEMKAKLSKVDTSSLSSEQKKKFKALWRRLNGEDEPASAFSLDTSGPFLALLVVGAAVAYVWQTSQQGSAGAAKAGAPTPIPAGAAGTSGGAALASEAREARLRRFEAAAGPTGGAAARSD
mmetsp:Transcript_54708/g.162842  ORF Transcript_54708/g.162842 Transcript_54708/m.162842 type:complete len:198 (-) Transcript_54708:47-640(-)